MLPTKINWSPILERTLSLACLTRIKKDIVSIQNEQTPGIFAVHDENDISLIHALIIGPKDTPYEGGLFYFLMRCPENYPMGPPNVMLMTTGAGTVIFNPHLSSSGFICLSILGTHEGPAWSPAQTLASVLVSIQSMLNENPFDELQYLLDENFGANHNEAHNNAVRHETIRVAVCGMLNNETHLTIPESLQKSMKKVFLENYDYYEDTVKKNINLNGQIISNLVRYNTVQRFQCEELLKRLQELRKKYKHEVADGKKKHLEDFGEKTSDYKRSKLETSNDVYLLSDTESDDDSD